MARWTYGCQSEKRRFASPWEADWALERIWKLAIRGTNNSSKLPCRSYQCDECRGYHHTSQPLHVYEETLYGTL